MFQMWNVYHYVCLSGVLSFATSDLSFAKLRHGAYAQEFF